MTVSNITMFIGIIKNQFTHKTLSYVFIEP
jgi:hypothetical protein